MIRVANAPVSFGVFELSAQAGNLPTADDVLNSVADAGYSGIDLGPPGFLGGREELRRSLRGRALDLAGGWVAMRFTEPRCLEADLRALDDSLDLFEAGSSQDPAWRPKPTLADAGSPRRRANPGRGRDLLEIGLDGDGWKLLAEGVRRAAERCRGRGFEPSFHHHAGTYVEGPHEIERLLELTDIGLCLDSGHLLLGGGDPVAALKQWAQRINQIHAKDCRKAVINSVIEDRAGMDAVWGRGAFCELGTGDVDVDGFLCGVKDSGFSGWIVVEQDRFFGPQDLIQEMAAAQVRNRDYLRKYGL
jgi:inosose dehydratase